MQCDADRLDWTREKQRADGRSLRVRCFWMSKRSSNSLVFGGEALLI